MLKISSALNISGRIICLITRSLELNHQLWDHICSVYYAFCPPQQSFNGKSPNLRKKVKIVRVFGQALSGQIFEPAFDSRFKGYGQSSVQAPWANLENDTVFISYPTHGAKFPCFILSKKVCLTYIKIESNENLLFLIACFTLQVSVKRRQVLNVNTTLDKSEKQSKIL